MNHLQLALIALTFLMLLAAYPPKGRVFSKAQACLSSFFKMKQKDEIRIGEISLSDEERVRHTHIVGATGSGKTVLLESLIYEDLRRGRGALIIDPKGDRDFYDRIKKFCKDIGRENDLNILSASYPLETKKWNPCRLGSLSEVYTKLFESWIYDNSFYKKASQQAILTAVNQNKDSFFLNDIVQALKKYPGNKEYIASVFMDLSLLCDSEWKEILCVAPSANEEISILDIVRKNEILFVDLPTEGRSAESSLIGRLLLQEFSLISGKRKSIPTIRANIPFSIFIDEFDAFATESFTTFQNKSRSSNFMIHLAHQTLSDLKKISPTFMGQILGNMNVRFIFRQDDPEDAEKWANFFGTKLVVKSTFRTSGGSATGEASNREGKEFRIHPDEIKELGVGECIFSSKTSRKLKKVTVPMCDPKNFLIPLPVLRPAKAFAVKSEKPESSMIVRKDDECE